MTKSKPRISATERKAVLRAARSLVTQVRVARSTISYYRGMAYKCRRFSWWRRAFTRRRLAIAEAEIALAAKREAACLEKLRRIRKEALRWASPEKERCDATRD